VALAFEHLGREQKRAAVDGRLLQVLAERDHSPLHDPDTSPLRPRRPVGGGIDEHGRLTGRQQPIQPAFAEDVVGRDQHEQRLAQDLPLNSGQRRAVPICPPVGIHDPDPVAPKATDDRRDRPRVVADHHQDPLQPNGEQGPHGPLDQAQAPQPEQRLGATPGDRCQPLGLARGQHHPNPRPPRQRRVRPDLFRLTGHRGQRSSLELWCLSHAPTPLWQQGKRRGNSARITADIGRSKTHPNRATSRGHHASPSDTRLWSRRPERQAGPRSSRPQVQIQSRPL
jgi:hypothetical protein